MRGRVRGGVSAGVLSANGAMMVELVGKDQFVARWRDRELGLDDLARLVLSHCCDSELRALAEAYLAAKAGLLEELESLGFQ
jgi:hypothetical protein